MGYRKVPTLFGSSTLGAVNDTFTLPTGEFCPQQSAPLRRAGGPDAMPFARGRSYLHRDRWPDLGSDFRSPGSAVLAFSADVTNDYGEIGCSRQIPEGSFWLVEANSG